MATGINKAKVISNLEKIGFRGRLGTRASLEWAEKRMDGELNTVSEDLDMPFELEETQCSQRGNVKSKVDFQDGYYSSFNADGKWRERN